MSSVNFLEKLLDGVAVEWRALGEVIKLEKGRQLNKELLSEDGLYPAYNGGGRIPDLPTHSITPRTKL